MRHFQAHCASGCKRDALPTELSARIAEIGHFYGFRCMVKGREIGTERKRREGQGPQTPGIVPDWFRRCSAPTRQLAGGLIALAVLAVVIVVMGEVG